MADNSPAGLAELLDQARLGAYLPKARTTLLYWGALDVSEVTNDPQLVEELASELALKRCERGRLKKAIVVTQQERVRDMKAIAAQQAKDPLPKDSIYV